MSGLSVVGQDYYGVFPLKGKLLNVREASPKQLQENAEIQNIKKILGLQHGKVYENVKDLRYGHLMIMADQVCTKNFYFVSTIFCICHFVMLMEHYMCSVGS
jgi:DNA gyrase/topoisomerase IV subunit B